jgi:GT2 family glycosyltransferase
MDALVPVTICRRWLAGRRACGRVTPLTISLRCRHSSFMTEHAAATPDRPLDVAVVIPAFNAGRYLDQTVASVAAQTRAPAVVVVADDASTDDTVALARRWQDHLPIQVVCLERTLGPGPARHRAILATDAPLLAMLDADDLWFPDHLETMAAAYQRAPGLVSARELAWIHGRGIDLARRRAKPPIPSDPKDQLAALLRHNYVSFGFFPRTLYERVGGFRGFLGTEDWDLWIRMLRSGARLTEASHPTALHRVRSGSLSVDPARIVEHGIPVLTAAAAEAQSPWERAAAERGLRALQARKRYYDVYALARDGHPWRARLAAVRGPRGGGLKPALGLAAMAMAPRASIQLERATRRYRVFTVE